MPENSLFSLTHEIAQGYDELIWLFIELEAPFRARKYTNFIECKEKGILRSTIQLVGREGVS